MHASSLELPDDDAGCVGEDELLRFVSGAVERGRADEIRAHVDVCDDCREGLGIAGQEAAASAPATPSEDRDRDGSWRIAVGSEVDGRFVIDREIGRGGMGVVYAATHLAMRRSVALKVLNEKTAEDEDCVTRVVRETRVAGKLLSPNAMRVFDVGRLKSGAPFMVMELLEGHDLEHILKTAKKRVIDVRESVQYVADACNAIGEAHRAGIVHRDVKLANIFVTKGPPSIVKVLDFGLAKGGGRGAGTDSSLTGANTMLGTPHYMSPEQLVSARDVDARADVWALGVALYRLLTRKYPFDSPHFASLVARILAGDPPAPPSVHRKGLPPSLERVILRCLERKAADRFADANALRAALMEAMEPVALDSDTVAVAKEVGAGIETMVTADTIRDAIDAAPEVETRPPVTAPLPATTAPVLPRPVTPPTIAVLAEPVLAVPLSAAPAPSSQPSSAHRAPRWPYAVTMGVVAMAVAGAIAMMVRTPAASPAVADPLPAPAVVTLSALPPAPSSEPSAVAVPEPIPSAIATTTPAAAPTTSAKTKAPPPRPTGARPAMPPHPSASSERLYEKM